MTVFSPVGEIRTLTDKNIAERCVAAVGRSREQHEIAADLAREQHRIPVKRQERILDSGKCLKIRCLRHTDRCAVEILTPDNIVGILHLHKSRIISVDRHEGLTVLVHKVNLVFLKIPVDGILASSQIDIRNSVRLFSAEDADELIPVRHYRTVEDSRHALHRISADDRVLLVSPYRCSV